MNELTAGPAIAQREKKHLKISNSINRLSEVTKHLETLISNIKGMESPESPATNTMAKLSHEPPQLPSLSEILNTSDENIRSFIDSSHSLISEIEDILF